MSFLYIFGKDTSIPFRRHTGEKKELTSGVNENDERPEAYHFRKFVKISSDRKFTVTKDRVVGKGNERENGTSERVLCVYVCMRKKMSMREKEGERTGQEKRW